MKKKELKNLAQRIAKQERIVQTSADPTEIKRAQEEILKLSSSVTNFEDIFAIDELVQEILSENS